MPVAVVPADLNAAFAATLVDEWARAGLVDAVVAPGSRSAPLALALARDDRVRLHVVLDERSAAFFALGLGLATGRPAVVCCTSGTAGAHFLPAVIEADLAGVPLLVCTANRPPELLDTGAGQTIDQLGLFGRAPRWFAAPGPPAGIDGAGAVWRAVAARAYTETLGPPAGPVHLDLAFREPLVPVDGGDSAPGAARAVAGRAGGAPWTVSSRGSRRLDAEAVGALAARLAAVERGLVVAGWGADVDSEAVAALSGALGWPVLADTISNVRCGPHAISTYDALLRDARFSHAQRPDLVLRLGAPLTSKAATAWLDPEIHQIAVDPDGRWLDPHRAVSERVAADADPLVGELLAALRGRSRPASTWLDGWLAAEHAARAAIDAILDADDVPFEGRIARDIAAAVPDGGALLVASSMPVRDLEGFAAPRTGVRVFANRGANGIDGLVSTTLGIACGRHGMDIAGTRRAATVALLGDLAFLHDCNGLLGAATRGIDATFVVVDNGGGGIFHFLPPRRLPEFEALFATPQPVDLAALAAVHGVDVARVEHASALESRARSRDRGRRRPCARGADRPPHQRRPPRGDLGRGCRRGRVGARSLTPVRGGRARGASVRASPASPPTPHPGRSRRRSPRRQGGGPGGRRAPRRATQRRTHRRPTRRPSRRGRCTDRARTVRGVAIASSAAARGEPLTAGVGCSASARSSADASRWRKRPATRVARCVTDVSRTGSGSLTTMPSHQRASSPATASTTRRCSRLIFTDDTSCSIERRSASGDAARATVPAIGRDSMSEAPAPHE